MDWCEYVKIDPKTYSQNEVGYLQASLIKAQHVLGCEPRVFFKDLVRIIVDTRLEFTGLKPPGEGARIIDKHHSNWHRWDSQVVSKGVRVYHIGEEFS